MLTQGKPLGGALHLPCIRSGSQKASDILEEFCFIASALNRAGHLGGSQYSHPYPLQNEKFSDRNYSFTDDDSFQNRRRY